MTWLLLLVSFVIAPVVQAGEVTLYLPDAVLKEAIDDVCLWHRCESDDHGGHKSEAEKARWVADKLIGTISLGRYKDLDTLGGKLNITMDTE